MIKNLTRIATAAALASLTLTSTPIAHGATSPPAVAAALAPDLAPTESAPIGVAVGRLPVATESRTGYTRDAFKHWNSGLNPTDGCTTRNEVLIAEAVEAPTVGARCALSGGSWWSYYDDTVVNAASALDIDHMVPLAEAWDSGAHGWTAARREAYAND
ncbi:HNH endonuclease, partial [Streptomyces sp. NPDC003860]